MNTIELLESIYKNEILIAELDEVKDFIIVSYGYDVYLEAKNIAELDLEIKRILPV